jgi:protoporphyrinogen oxidase
LTRAGHDVTIYEAESAVGGLAAGFKDDGWDWHLEKFYHHWFQTDAAVLTLLDEMGCRDKVLFPRPRTSYWMDGKIYRSEMNASMLRLPLSPIALFR